MALLVLIVANQKGDEAMKEQKPFLTHSKAPNLSPLQQARIQEILSGQAELVAVKSESVGLLEAIKGLISWPRRIIFIRRLWRF